MKMFRRFVLICSLAVAISGCASFAKQRIEPVKAIPQPMTSVRPDVAVELKFFVGNPDKGAAESAFAAAKKHQQAIAKVLEDSKLFNRYSFDPVTGANYPYKLKLVFFNDFSRAGAFISGFLTGATFGVVPGGGSDNYTLKASLQRPDAATSSLRVEDGVTNLIGLLFLPLAGNTPEKASRETLDNMVKEVLRQWVLNGEFGPISLGSETVAGQQ